MAKSIKFKNDTYLDSTSIIDNKILLSVILNDNIIDSKGDNKNGSYIKYKNGIMICCGTVSMGNQTFTTDYWSTFNRSGNENMRITYPLSFISIPMCTLSSVCNAGILVVNLQGTLKQTPGFTIITPKSANTTREVIVNYIAIGKWK